MQYSFSAGSQDGSDVWVAVGVVGCVIVGRGVEVKNGVLVSTTGFVVGSGDGTAVRSDFGSGALEQPATVISINNKNSRFIRPKYNNHSLKCLPVPHPHSIDSVG